MRGAEAPAGALALPEDPAVRCAVTDREFGNVSLVVGDGDAFAARARLLEAVELAPGDAVFMEQVHGARVARVSVAERGRGLTARADAVPGVDALVTTDAGIGLVVLVADCVPVLLAAPGRGVAAVHAGRRGVVGHVVSAAVRELAAAAGLPARRIVAVIGPAIGGCCYELPADVAHEVAEAVPEARATTRWGAASADLPSAVLAQLGAAGVEAVTHLGGCTHCRSDRWFSHRATTTGEAPAGRQAAVVARLAGNGEPSFLD